MHMSGDDDAVRARVVRKLSTIVPETLARKIERSIFNWTIRTSRDEFKQCTWAVQAFRFRYTTKALSISFNLSNSDNPGLLRRVLDGVLTPKEVCCASPEKLWPEYWAPIMERVAAKALKKQLTVDLENCPDGAFACRRCKSLKSTYYQMQTRSADEPMTTFVACLSCGNRWKC